MDTILLIILVILLGATLGILYLNLRSKPKDENENKEAEELANLNAEIVRLKDSLNSTINTSLSSNKGPYVYKIGINNLTNEKIYDFAISSTFHDDNHYGLSNVYPLPERNFFIDFKYTF